MPEYTESSFISQGVRAFNPFGHLASLADELHLSQAVVLPPNIHLVVTSGQCGFRDDFSLPEDITEQVMLAFENAEKTLKAAGVIDGWKSVYQLTTYAPELTEEWSKAITAAKGKYLGTNRPTWTGVTVPSLYGGAILEMTIYAVASQSQERGL